MAWLEHSRRCEMLVAAGFFEASFMRCRPFGWKVMMGSIIEIKAFCSSIAMQLLLLSSEQARLSRAVAPPTFFGGHLPHFWGGATVHWFTRSLPNGKTCMESARLHWGWNVANLVPTPHRRHRLPHHPRGRNPCRQHGRNKLGEMTSFALRLD
jgi:hypothetical protein